MQFERKPTMTVNMLKPTEADADLVSDLRRRVEAHEQEIRGRAAKEQHSVHRQQYGDLFSYFREGSALASVVSDEVGVVMGKIKAVATAAKIPVLSELVDNLYEAIERQMVMYYNEMRASAMHSEVPSPDGGSPRSDLFSQIQTTGRAQARQRSESTFSASVGRQSSGRTMRLPSTVPLSKGSLIPSSTPPVMPSVVASSAPSISSGPTKIGLSESLSATTAFFAEALAVALRAECVRIYLTDNKKNLRRAAVFPFATSESDDPLNGNNYSERGLAKSLFTVVCEKGLAVSGMDSRPAFVAAVAPSGEDGEKPPKTPLKNAASTPLRGPPSQGDFDGNVQSTSLGKSNAVNPHVVRTCLVWPIVMPGGHLKIAGMIHAINKEGTSDEERKRFSADDEATMHNASKLFGIILERYPKELFGAEVGALIHRMCHPDRLVKPHLPPVISDEVEGAMRIANEALRADPTVLIYRGPMNTVFKQSIRDRKAEEYNPSANGGAPSASGSSSGGPNNANAVLTSTITTVEYNLDALNDLWKAGYDENVIMHEQCRVWNGKVRELNTIIRHFVDAIVVARGIKDMNEMMMYLRSLELLVRSENGPLMLEQISTTLEQIRKSLREEHRGQEAKAILGATPNEIDVVAKKWAKGLATKESISSIHIDGPSTVRGYTCDPATKREQVRAINALMDFHKSEEEKKQIQESGPPYAQPTESSVKKVCERPPPPEGEVENASPLKVPTRMQYVGLSSAGKGEGLLRLKPPAPPMTPKRSGQALKPPSKANS